MENNTKKSAFKKILAGLLAVLLMLPMFSSCGENNETKDPTGNKQDASSVIADASDSPSESSGNASSEDRRITVSFTSKDGKTNCTEEGRDSVSLAPGVKYQVRDKITIKLSEEQHYLAVSLCEKAGEAIVYLPKGEFVYQIPSDGKNFLPPAMFNTANTITARIPTAEELSEERNLALNPYDINAKSSVFPHAQSNNQYNAAEFGAHNVLDGCKRNQSHGNYPYQSWGALETVKKSDWLTVDFGREIEADTLTLYLRADFSSNHDAYFSSVTVEFSDGSSKVITPERKKDAQSFSLGGVKTSSIKLTGFVTDKSRGTWAGYTEVEVYGREVAAK